MITENNKQRHNVGALIILVINLLIAILACLFLGFVFPVYEAMFADMNEPLPSSAQFLATISSPLMAFGGIGLVGLVGLVVGLIIRSYLVLFRRGDKKVLLKRLGVMCLSIVLLTGWLILSAFSVICRMGEIIRG